MAGKGRFLDGAQFIPTLYPNPALNAFMELNRYRFRRLNIHLVKLLIQFKFEQKKDVL
jgi:hypothetical protein